MAPTTPWNVGNNPTPSTSSTSRPATLTQLKYVLFSWPNNHLTKRDPIAQEWFKSKCQMHSFAQTLGGFPLALWEGSLGPDKPVELFASGEQCKVLMDAFAEKMGPTRAAQTWKRDAVHHGSEVDGLKQLEFANQASVEAKFAQLKDDNDRYETRTHAAALSRAQEIVSRIQAEKRGEARFCAIDIETYERDHDIVTEVGLAKSVWRDGKFEPMEIRHLVVKENSNRRNGKFCPDARDHFHFGDTETYPAASIVDILSDEVLRPACPVFLLFHDYRSDIKSLQLLGLSTSSFLRVSPLPPPDVEPGYTKPDGRGRYMIDTQVLFSGYNRRKRQTRLADAVKQLKIYLEEPRGEGGYASTGNARHGGDDELRFHNSGNDAWATIQLFWKLAKLNLELPE